MIERVLLWMVDELEDGSFIDLAVVGFVSAALLYLLVHIIAWIAL